MLLLNGHPSEYWIGLSLLNFGGLARTNTLSIIIMSCRQHGYPWPSLATSPYHSSPPAGLQGYILCPHIVAVCKFELVVLLLHGHMWGSIGVHHLWARPCFSSSVRVSLLVGWLVGWLVGFKACQSLLGY